MDCHRRGIRIDPTTQAYRVRLNVAADARLVVAIVVVTRETRFPIEILPREPQGEVEGACPEGLLFGTSLPNGSPDPTATPSYP